MQNTIIRALLAFALFIGVKTAFAEAFSADELKPWFGEDNQVESIDKMLYVKLMDGEGCEQKCVFAQAASRKLPQ